MPHEWTAESLYETVNGWPKEAWPDESHPNLETWKGGECLNMRLMVLLFAASGLSWLIDTKQACPSVYTLGGRLYECDIGCGRRWTGPTLLHAISEAIKHTQGKD